MSKHLQVALLICLFPFMASGQHVLEGKVNIDSSWAPKIYISEIPNLHELYKCSEDMIIGRSSIDEDGKWRIELPSIEESRIYRLHISKKGFPSASLIIGGSEQNHGFVALGNDAYLEINEAFSDLLLPDFSTADYLNEMMKKAKSINESWVLLDKQTSDQQKKMSIRRSAIDELYTFADTCSLLLPSIYAVYLSDGGFNKLEVIQQMDKLRAKHGPHAYFNDYPSRESDMSGFRYLFIFAMIVILSWIGFKFKRTKDKDRLTKLFQSLSQREREVFYMVKSGKTNKEIAYELNLEISTIKSHVNSIFNKLKISSRKDVHLYH